MKIIEQDVLYVAHLANLELTDRERQRMVRDLNSILDYIDRLNELDTTNVPAMTQAFTEGSPGADGVKAADSLRADELRPCLAREAALSNAPDSDGAFFKVPRVIER
jgi:aspartyl-tRNA(Asn)/glutamyl-tRNA(Gln) amidotransferase subunit C